MAETEVLCEADEPLVLEGMERLHIEASAGSKRKSKEREDDSVSLEKRAMPWRGKRQHAKPMQSVVTFHVDRLTDRHPYASLACLPLFLRLGCRSFEQRVTLVEATVRLPSRNVSQAGEHVKCQCVLYGYPDPQSVRRQLPRLLEVHDWDALLEVWIVTHEVIPGSLQTRARLINVDPGKLYDESKQRELADRQCDLFTTSGRRTTL